MDALDNQLLGLETEFWQSMKNKDIDAALRLTTIPQPGPTQRDHAVAV